MTTFVLKKYDQTNNDTNKDPSDLEEIDSDENKETNNEITFKVEGTISKIVASALYSVFSNKVKIEEIEETVPENNEIIKAISTEDINKDPISTFNSINKEDVVFIKNKGFTTSKEEWFLTNIPNKTNKVFYTIESLIKYIANKLDFSYV